MALLADAYAEAHLDLDPLDRDLAAAEAKIIAAFERIEAAARIKVTLDTSGVDADLARLEARLKDQTINIDARLNEASFAEVEAESAALQALWDDLNVVVDVETTGITDAAEQLTGLEAIIQGINASEATFIVDPEGVVSTLTALTAVEALKERIDGSDATFQVNADGIAEVLAGAELIREFLRTIPNVVRTRFDFDGLAKAVPELIEARLAIAAIPNRVRTVIDVDTSFVDRLRGLFRGGGNSSILGGLQDLASNALSGGINALGGALDSLDQAFKGVGENGAKQLSGLSSSIGGFVSSGAGILAIANAFGLLGSTLAALIAYLAPLATGFLAAAGGLLAFAGAATIAVAAVGGLALLTAPGGIEGLAGIFENFKSTVQSSLGDILAPIRDFLTSDVISRFTVSIVQAVGTLAPFFEGTVGPIIDAILRLIDTFGALSGPAALAVGAGIGKLIDTFTQFAGAINQDVVVEGVNALFDALQALLELLGETGVAFAPILNTLLSGFAGLTRGAIEPFLQIIGTFGQAVGPLGESLGNILRPLGDLAIVFGQVVAAGAPLFDTFFQLSTLAIPTLNFEVLQVAAERIFPVLFDVVERLAPVIDQAAQAFVQLTSALFSDGNLGAISDILESLILQFSGFIIALGNASPLISAFFRILLEGFRASVIVASSLQLIVVGVAEAFVTAVDLILDAVGGLLTGVAELADLPVISEVLPEGAGDALRNWGDGAREALDGTRNFLAEVRGGIVDTAAIAAGLSDASGGLDQFGNVARSGTQALDDYAVKVETVASSFELIGPAAGLAAQALAQVTASFPGTIKALDAFKKEFASGSLLKNALAAQQKAVQSQTQAAQKAAQASANAVKATVQSTLGGGRLSSFFQLSDIVPENAADQARDAAKRIQDGVKEFLGQGKLSDFLKDEKGNIDRALDSLVASLTLKAQNISRLRFIDSLGFSDLAVQLATLADSPKALRKALDQLTAGGTQALADANAKLGVGRRAIEAQLGGLSPALSAALGQAFGEEATSKVQKGGDNINQALDKLADGIRTRAENVKRLQALQNLGFSDLALQLATLADNPEALNAALDQLAAGGVAAMQRANGRLAGERANLEATMARIDPALASALGATPGEQTTGAVEEAGVNIFGALDALKASFAQRLNNIGRLRFLESLGFTDLAAELATLDPDQLTTVLDQLGAAGADGIRAFNEQFITTRDAAFAQAATLDPRTLENLAAGYPEVAKAVEDGLIKTQGQVAEVISRPGVFFRAGEAGGAGSVLPPELLNQAEQIGVEYGTVAAKSLQDSAPALAAQMQELFKAVAAGGGAAATAAGLAAGLQLTAGLVEGTRLSGALVGASFGQSLSNGVATAAPAFIAATQRTIDLTVRLAGTVSQLRFSIIGIQSIEAFQEAVQASAARVSSRLASAFVLIGVASGEAFGAGVQLGIIVSTQDLNVGFGLLERFVPVLNALGFNLGTQFGVGFVEGLTTSLTFAEVVAATLALKVSEAVRRALDINSPSGVALELGTQFGDGLAIGLLRTTSDVELAAKALADAATVSLPQPDPIVVDVVPNLRGDLVDVLSTPTEAVTTAVPTAAPTVIATAATTQAALLPSDIAAILLKLDQVIAAVGEVERPLFGDYTVNGVERPQSPDQIVRDAAFAKAVLS